MTSVGSERPSLVETIKAQFGLRGPAAAEEAQRRTSDHVVMIEGGRNVRSGSHKGKAAFAALVEKIKAEADEFSAPVQWVTGDESLAFSLSHAQGKRNGRSLDTFVLTMFKADDHGNIVEIRDLPFDWTAWEDFWE